MAENPEIQISLSLDTTQLDQQIPSVEQQLLQRMNATVGQGAIAQPATGMGATTPVVSSSVPQQETIAQAALETSGAVPPPLPPLPRTVAPPPPPEPDSQTTAAPSGPIAVAQQELERLRTLATTAPDVAMLGLRGVGGSGGLFSSVSRAALNDPQNAEEYQELLEGIRGLTRSLRDNIKESEDSRRDPLTRMADFMRTDARARTLGVINNSLMNGDLPAAGGAGAGAAIGAFFGPAGALTGAQIGQMIGGTVSGFLEKTKEASNYNMQITDLNARFGQIGSPEDLQIEALNRQSLSGYTAQETAQLVDALRQSHVVKDMDDRAVELARSIQELTRATGLSTEAMVQSYASYRTGGGRDTAEGFTAQMIAGAVATGMRENLQEYMEIVGSARGSLVMRSFQADEGDVGLRGIQGVLSNLMGQDNRTAQLLQDNPMMAQQMLSGFLAAGGATPFSNKAAMMQLSGVAAGDIDQGFSSPETKVKVAGTMYATAVERSLFSDIGLGLLGMGSQQELFDRLQQDPNFLQNALSGDLLDTNRKAELQKFVRQQGAATLYGDARMAENLPANDLTMITQIATAMGRNQGRFDLSAPVADGQSLKDALTKTEETEAAKARRAQEELSKATLNLYDSFKELTPQLIQVQANLVNTVKDVVEIIQRIPGLGGPDKSLPIGADGKRIQLDPTTLEPIPEQDQNRTGFDVIRDWLGKTADAAKQKVSEAASTASGVIKDPIGSMDRTVDDMFNDTPFNGVIAGPGYDTFQFAHGDRVLASMGGSGMAPSVNINLNLTVPDGADASWVGSAARQGTQSAIDEWLNQWEAGGLLQPRNRPRIANRMY